METSGLDLTENGRRRMLMKVRLELERLVHFRNHARLTPGQTLRYHQLATVEATLLR